MSAGALKARTNGILPADTDIAPMNDRSGLRHRVTAFCYLAVQLASMMPPNSGTVIGANLNGRNNPELNPGQDCRAI